MKHVCIMALVLCGVTAWGRTFYVDPERTSAQSSDRRPGTAVLPLRTIEKAVEQAGTGDTIRIMPASPPATYYVDRNHPHASDDNPGTTNAPFLTVQQAANVVQPGDTVKIRPGRYREGVIVYQCGRPLDFKGEWNAQRVTFEADGGEVIMDGSWRVPDEAWQPVEGKTNVFVATVDRPTMNLGGIHTIKAPAPEWCFAEEKLLLPNVSPQRGRNKPMSVPDDDEFGRWCWDNESGQLSVNLGGKKPGPGVPIDLSVRYHAFGGWEPLHYCTFRGLTFQRYSHGALYGGMTEVWVDDCLFRHNTLAMGGMNGGHVVRCSFLDHDGTVLNLGGGSTLYAQNIFVRYYSDYWSTRNFYNSCAIKSFGSDTYFSIRNNVILDEGVASRGYGGCGGIWFDNPSQGNFVYGNTIARAAMGMYIEYPMMNALITWNTVSDVNEGIVLRHNTANHIVENYISGARTRGIKLQDTTRARVPIMKYNFLSGNVIEDCGIGIAAGPQHDSHKQEVNIADGNTYDLRPGQVVADWANAIYETVEEFRAGAGMEMHGRTGRVTPDELGLVTFRCGDSDHPWKTYAMFGNPHLDRIQFNRSEYGEMQAKTFPGLPYFYEPGMGDGSRRKWYNGFHRDKWPLAKRRTHDNSPHGLSWFYTSAEPWTAVIAAANEGTWMSGGRGAYMLEEEGLTGRGGGAENGHLQVMSRGPEGAPPEGLGWMTVSLPTAPGAVIDIGLWMQAVNVKAVEEAPHGGAVVLVEWSDYTRTRVARSFIVGRDANGEQHLPELVTGNWNDYRRVEGTVTAPEWAKRFRVFMGLRSATGILQLDDIDSIRTRPGQAPADAEEHAMPLSPVHHAKLVFAPLGISAHLNRGLMDDKAGDGKGGWTDEGPQLDMRSITPGRKTYERVPYQIETSPSCAVLKSPARPAGELPDSLSIPVPEAQGTDVLMLCFLHAVAGAPDVEHWRYVIHYADGSSETISMVAGKNIRDWTDVTDWLGEPGTWRAFAAESTGGLIHPRQSTWVLEWKNPYPEKEIRAIEMVGAGNGVPILLAITLGQAK